MGTDYANILRKYENSEATLVGDLMAKQWGYAEDTRRLTVCEEDGVTFRHFPETSRLSAQDGVYGAEMIGVDGIAGVSPYGGGGAGTAGTVRGMLIGGLSAATNTNFLATVPGSSSRNRITLGGDYYGLSVRAYASQTQALQRWEDSAGVPYSYVDNVGQWVTSFSQASAITSTWDNTNNSNGAADSRHLIRSGGSSGGDPFTTWQVNAGGVVSFGIDNSDSDAAVLSMSTSLGTTNAQRWTSAGTTIPGTLGVTGVQSNSEALAFVANGTSGTGRVWKSAGAGLSLRGTAGSSYDLSLMDAAGGYLIRNPTGATSLEFPGASGISVTGTLTGTGDWIGTASNHYIRSNTSDAADNKALWLVGGGAVGDTRGSSVNVNGNENGSAAGAIVYTAGNVATGIHLFYVGSAVEAVRIAQSGAMTTLGITASGDVTVSKSTASNTSIVSATQTDNTSGTSHARLQAVSGGGSGGDAFTRYAITGVTEWSTGIDNSDSDAYVIAASSALGTSNALRITTAGAVTIPGTLAVTGNIYTPAKLGIGSNASSPTYDLEVNKDTSGDVVHLVVRNGSNTAGAASRIAMLTSGATAADSYLYFSNTVRDWTIGLDNSDSDALVFAESNTLGTSNRLRIAVGGAVSIPGTLDVTGLVTLSSNLVVNGEHILVPTVAGTPSGLTDRMLWYNSSSGHLCFREGGVTYELT